MTFISLDLGQVLMDLTFDKQPVLHRSVKKNL